MSHIIEKLPQSSFQSEDILAPPSTPMSETPKPESQNGTRDETAQDPSSTELREPSLLDAAGRRTSRKRGRHRLAKLKPSLVLENSGSVARDHLASERTFLAYVRTSLLLATTGVALVQLFAVASTNPTASTVLMQIRRFAHPLGATLVVFALLVLGLGVRRYFVIQAALINGVFPVTRFAVAAITFILSIIIIIVFGVLISSRN